MLRRILSIAGRPGLFKLASQGKNMLIVEELASGKKTPAYATEKIISLNDIAIYTDEGEVSLASVFDSIKKKENGAATSVKPSNDADQMRAYFEEVLPNFDRTRVHVSDIKKVMVWYNLLVGANMTDFVKEEKAEA
ncbi:MAG: hypothetical protein E7077_15635 [Bacteroidales bacterium]|jgi:hypothetical protein|nr:hypothetical protein [Bacteroidales bacterium]MBR5208274.1 DUF5606 domain-containing protein [Paludibacteraceae bacterium]MEE1063801.1 DUF5606 domain-containing protein [Paludibacteraceae bacterium]